MPENQAEKDYTSDEALGLRVADCDCCYIVDKMALDLLGAEYVRLRRAVQGLLDNAQEFYTPSLRVEAVHAALLRDVLNTPPEQPKDGD